MKKIFFISIVIIFQTITTNIFAQQDAMFSQYMFNTMSLNPAYAGSSKAISSSFITRHQWIGIKGAPSTQSFAIHSPFKKNVGLGLSIINDVAGPINNLSIQTNYSYNLTISENSLLYMGLMLGLNNVNIKLNSLNDINVDDLSFTENLNTYRPVFGFGLYYRQPNAYVGFSIPDIVETSYTNNQSNWEHKRHLFLIAGYVMDINNDIKDSKDLNTLFETYKKQHKEPEYIIIDEIQDIKDWEFFVR